MTAHEAIHIMADAYRTLNYAMNFCTNAQALKLMSDVKDKIYEVGEKKFGREFVATLRESQVD